MILFIDASAMVAVLAPESDHKAFEARIAEASRLLFSPIAAWETVTALCRSHQASAVLARTRVQSFLRTFDFHLIGIGDREGQIALDAYKRYGKGRHPARLNMGDCFAYACAKANDAQLLYKGDDFALTDLA